MRSTERLAVLLLVGVLLNGCGAPAETPPSPREVLAISCDELTSASRDTEGEPVARTVSVAVGEPFQIILCSNPSTGFSWEEPVISGSANATVVERQTAPASESMAGASGSDTFTFRAGSVGAATIDFSYSRPWEGGEKGAWKVTVKVDVN
jgi:predicted secreted protein